MSRLSALTYANDPADKAICFWACAEREVKEHNGELKICYGK